MSVSIVIPTARRPGPLAEAMASALALRVEAAVELVVVDNDPAGSARRAVLEAATGASIPVRYVHAPEPGVANARNAGVRESRGRFIAFLDDDEVAPTDWLSALMSVQRQFDADAVFGPVRTRLPQGRLAHADYFADFFSRPGPSDAQIIAKAHGCGCSLVRRAALPDPIAPFAAERNRIGGEDDLMFATMQAAGRRFAWAPEAWVWEAPDPARLTLRYTLKRAFTFGQGPCSAAWARGPRAWAAIPLWMAVGALQLIGFGLVGLWRRLRGDAGVAAALDRSARGLGKILWFPPFKIDFYGRSVPGTSRS